MKPIIFVSLLNAIFSCSERKEVHFLKIEIKEAVKIAKEENKKVLVDFFSKGCFPCSSLQIKVFEDNHISHLSLFASGLLRAARGGLTPR
jgi:thioredoxin-related protein